MDILSHGLYGGIAFGRKSKQSFWWSFFFGMAPDLFSFGLYTIGTWVGFFDHPDWRLGRHVDPNQIPSFVYTLYNVTHSFIIFLVIFFLIWLILRKPLWVMASWGVHIIFDIPTHSTLFFPTPFLWPISNFHINGRAWNHLDIFLPNVALLIGLYVWFFVIKPRRMAHTMSESTLQKQKKVL